MAVRMTGMISGLDTESLIKGMVDAQKMKNKRTSDKSTLLEWKQEKWKDLNAKLYKLYTDDLSKLRMTSSYGIKNVTSSNENLVSIKGGTNAPVGTHTIEDITLAKAQSMTSAKLEAADGEVKSSTLLTSLKNGTNKLVSGTILKIAMGSDEPVLFEVTDTTKISDLTTALKTAGLNANFDENQGRMFISSKKTGSDNQFTISSSYNGVAITAKENLKVAMNYTTLVASDKASVNTALEVLSKGKKSDDDQAYINAENLIINKMVDAKKNEIAQAEYERLDGENLSEDKVNLIRAEKELEVRAELTDSTEEEILAEIEKRTQVTVVEKREALRVQANEYATNEMTDDIKAGISQTAISNITAYQQRVNDDGTTTTDVLSVLGLGSVSINSPAQDSSFKYNGLIIEGSSNEISIDGFTISLKGELAAGEKITFTSSNDTQATYDMVKNFVKNYNALLKEMNDLFYAESSRGYDPLSEEEMDTMSEKQIEKWESKIKDSILRRDNTIGSITSIMRLATTKGYADVEGPYKSLASLGITTSSVYTENGLLHIHGDAENSTFASYDDKLMKALQDDPDAVIELLTTVSGELYSQLDEKMSAIPNVRSKFNFYNDKLMVEEQGRYKKKIAQLEGKLVDMENKYYKQFAAMETAMAKMQSQGNALAGMLGTGQQ